MMKWDNREDIENYLYNHADIDGGGRTRHDFGYVYEPGLYGWSTFPDRNFLEEISISVFDLEKETGIPTNVGLKDDDVLHFVRVENPIHKPNPKKPSEKISKRWWMCERLLNLRRQSGLRDRYVNFGFGVRFHNDKKKSKRGDKK